MKYVVYKTINLKNHKFYIGVHLENYKEYLGSGLLIKQAIKKYGKLNFKRLTLFEFDTKEAAYQMEALLLSQNIGDSQCYNLAPGGCGGYVGKEAYLKVSKKLAKRTLSKSHLVKMRQASSGAKNAMYGKPAYNRTPVIGTNLDTGETFKFESKSKAYKVTKISIGKIIQLCKGQIASYKSWTFKSEPC
jgi:hypothetical protein